MAKLVLNFNGETLREYELDKETMMIGRKADNDIHIDNLSVSSKHAKVLTILNDSFIEDLESTNGTLINGERISKHALKNGETITIGKHELTYVNEAADAGTGDFEKTIVIRADAAGMPEQDETAVDHDDVPFDGNAHRNAARDEGVKEEHDGKCHGCRRSPVAQHQDDRERVLHCRAGVGHEVCEPGRAQIVRVAAVEELANRPDTRQRAVALHDRNHRWEMMVELRSRSPHPDGDPHELRTGEPVAYEHEANQRRVVVLRARREKDGFVGEPEEREKDERWNEELAR